MKSITAIKEEFKNLTPEEISAQIVLYQNDERKGVQSFLLSQKKKVEKYFQDSVIMCLFVELLRWAGDH